MKKLLFVLIFVLVLPFIAMADDDVPVLPGGAAIVESPEVAQVATDNPVCLLYTSPSPRDLSTSRMPSSA